MPGRDCRDGGGRPPRVLLAVLCAAAVANVYYAQPLLERIGTELAIPVADLGWVVTLSQLGYLVGLVALVPLGDLVPRRALITVQLAATAVGTTVAATASTATGLFVGVAVAGLFSVVVQVAVAFAAAISDPSERGGTIGFVTSGVVVGIILARTVSGAVADVAGWRAVYVGSAVLCAALALAASVTLPRDRRRDHGGGRGRRYLAGLASVVVLTATDRTFRVRAGMTFFLFASFGVLWSGIALPLSAAPWHLSTTAIGLFGVAGLAGALGAARAGRWADRGHGQVVTVVALVLLIASWAAIGRTTSSLLLLGVGVVVLDFAVQAVHVTSQNQIVATRPEAGSRIIGGYMVFYSLGSAAGAFTTTALYDAAGWGVVSLAGAGYATAALVVWAIDRMVRRPSHGGTARAAAAAHGSAGVEGGRR